MDFVPARNPEHFLYKNKLQEHAQKSLIPLPMYQTINEGTQHAPKFRSFVVIDGVEFVSFGTFRNRKEAEQDAARIALEGILQKTKQEGMHLIHHDKVFCKSILNDYAMKANVDKPIYSTTQSEGLIPVFVSTLVFGGKSYVGDLGKSKKEAEQLAARVAIEFILSSSDTKALMSQIIKSKSRLYATVYGTDTSAVNMNINADFAGSAEDQSGSRIVGRKAFSVAVENDRLAVGHNSEVLLSCEHLNTEVPCFVPHELKNPKEEVICQGNSELTRSKPCLPTLAQGHPLSELRNSGVKLTHNNSNSQQNNQAIASVGASTVPEGSQVMLLSHNKKRSPKTRNDQKQEKKTKIDEDFIRLSSDSPLETPNTIGEYQIVDS